jgi:hypothetical protein
MPELLDLGPKFGLEVKPLPGHAGVTCDALKGD